MDDTSNPEREGGELVIERGKLEAFLPVLGVEVTEDEKLRNIDTGEILTSESGDELTIDEMGYLGVDDDGGVLPVEDDFTSIVEHLSDRDIR